MNTALQPQVSLQSGEYFSTIRPFEIAIFQTIGNHRIVQILNQNV